MVDRCICESRTFAEILRLAKKEGLTTVHECQDHKLCGTRCERCIPYMEEALKTGQVRFTIQPVPSKSS